MHYFEDFSTVLGWCDQMGDQMPSLWELQADPVSKVYCEASFFIAVLKEEVFILPQDSRDWFTWLGKESC